MTTLLRLLFSLMLVLAVSTPLMAQVPTPPSPLAAHKQVLDGTKLQLDQLDRALQNRDLTDAQLVDLRRSVLALPDKIIVVINDVQPRVDLLKARLKELGPKPADGNEARFRTMRRSFASPVRLRCRPINYIRKSSINVANCSIRVCLHRPRAFFPRTSGWPSCATCRMIWPPSKH